MGTSIAEPVKAHVRPFANEPVADFSKTANREAMEQALREVREQLGREYNLLIAGRREKTADKLKSCVFSGVGRGAAGDSSADPVARRRTFPKTQIRI